VALVAGQHQLDLEIELIVAVEARQARSAS
jgi:hypothetical protein